MRQTAWRIVKELGRGAAVVALMGLVPALAFAEDEAPYTVPEHVQDSRGLAHQFDMFEEYDPNNKEHVERVDQHFDKVDANDDGQWTQDEVGDAWFTPKRFANADKNSDGILTSEEVKGEIEWEGDHAGRLTHDLRKHTRQEVHAEMQQRWNNATPEEREQFKQNHPRAAERLDGGRQRQARERDFTTAEGDSGTTQEQRRRNEEGDTQKRRRTEITDEEGNVIGRGRQGVMTTDEGTLRKGEKIYTTDEGDTAHIQRKRAVTDEGVKEGRRGQIIDEEGNVVSRGRQGRITTDEGTITKGEKRYTTEDGNTAHVQQRSKVTEDGRVVQQRRGRVEDEEGNVIRQGGKERGKNAEGDKYRKQKRTDDQGRMERRGERTKDGAVDRRHDRGVRDHGQGLGAGKGQGGAHRNARAEGSRPRGGGRR